MFDPTALNKQITESFLQAFPRVFFSFWPLFLFLGVLLLIRILGERLIENSKNWLLFRSASKWHSDRELIAYLRRLRPSEFEGYIAGLFKALGYETNAVGGGYDGGVDVIAIKNGVKHYIQCKKYISSKVSVSEVRDFYGAIADRVADGKGLFITTNIFTTEAERFAEGKPIELIDGNGLVKIIASTRGAADTIGPEAHTSALPTTCSSCGGKLVERKGKFGPFLGCLNYPKCKHTEQI